jgi:CubicO group peptidase (beta-lactamase class C family)
MKRMFSRFVVVLLLAAQATYMQAQPASLAEIFEDYELMGMSVAVVCDLGVQSYHFGLRNYALELPVNDDTKYRIASISKLLTAMGLMKLYEQGAFGLDEDVSGALGFSFRNPNWPDVPITYRMLLSHTAGFQDGTGYGNFLSATYGNENPPAIDELCVPGGNYYTANMWRLETPGTFFAYSNATYGIIGTLIEAHSNERFDVYMKNNVLQPLGITGSYNVTDIENIADVAVLYRNQGGWNPQVDDFQGEQPVLPELAGYAPGTNGLIFSPQGGLRASVKELASVIAVFKGIDLGVASPLEPATLLLMQTPHWTYNGSNGDNYYGLFRSWGLGVHCTTATDGGDIVFGDLLFRGHAGEAYGLISDLYWRTDINAGFVFMTNGAWDGFDFGNQSAYYTLEEEVFAAINGSDFFGCLTGINEVTGMFKVYPNPATTGYIHIEGPQPRAVIIKSLNGAEVYRQTAGFSGNISLSGLADGYYAVEITGDHYRQILPLVVMGQ